LEIVGGKVNKKEVAEMADLKRGFKDLEKKVDCHLIEQREDFDKVFRKLDHLQGKFAGKFAGKWVEKVIIGIVIAAGAGLIGVIITL